MSEMLNALAESIALADEANRQVAADNVSTFSKVQAAGERAIARRQTPGKFVVAARTAFFCDVTGEHLGNVSHFVMLCDSLVEAQIEVAQRSVVSGGKYFIAR
jgi:hypothetical protein